MVENVEEFGAELSMDSFAQVPVLSDREIKVPEPRTLKHVPAHVSELPQRRRHHDGVSRRIAAKQIQSSRFRTRTPAIYRKG